MACCQCSENQQYCLTTSVDLPLSSEPSSHHRSKTFVEGTLLNVKSVMMSIAEVDKSEPDSGRAAERSAWSSAYSKEVADREDGSRKTLDDDSASKNDLG